MSVELNFPFTTPTNYTYDSAKIEISSGLAKLLLSGSSGTFTEDYADDTDFTYDSDKSEFTGGKVQQIYQVPTDCTMGISLHNDVHGCFGGGVLTGTPVNGASISGNKLDLKGSTVQYVDYDADLNADSQQTGCIRFKITPNYTGSPSTSQVFLITCKIDGDSTNEVNIFHASTGELKVNIRDQVGASIAGALAAWAPTSGVTYEIEVNFDITAGETRIFVDGVLHASDLVGTGTRDSNIGLLRIGSNSTGIITANFEIEDILYFSTVQHTTGYTPGYTVAEEIYLGDAIDLPDFVYSGGGSLQSLSSFVATDSDVRYVVNGKYWTGSAWATSDNSWAQANTASDINTNIASLTIGSNTVTVKVITNDGSTQGYADELSIGYSGEAYPTDNPTVLMNTTFRCEALEGFTETATKPANTEIKYILKKDTTWYYWTGSAWAESDGTYSQANTAAEIETNKASFVTSGSTVQVKAFLNTTDTSATPELDNLAISYDFAGDAADAISKCIVYGHNKDQEGNPSTDTFIIRLFRDAVQYKDNVTIRDERLEITPDSDGYWEAEIVENANMDDADAHYIFDFGGGNRFLKIVPNEDSKNFYDLADYNG